MESHSTGPDNLTGVGEWMKRNFSPSGKLNGFVLLGGSHEGAPAASNAPLQPLATARHLQWNSDKVGEWLAKMGLGQYARNFAEHRVTGDLLDLLTEGHMKELGVTLVGHRLLLVREIGALHRKGQARERERVIWRSAELLGRAGPAGALREHLCCEPCLRERDRYLLTASTLLIESAEPQQLCGRQLWCCPVRGRTKRSIDLTGVAGVAATNNSRWWHLGCEADDVQVDLSKELGLPPVPPLRVANGTGNEIAESIRRAVEEVQAFEAGHGGAQPLPMHMALRA